MELRSSKALAWREERGRAGRAAAKRWGGMGREVEDMVFGGGWFGGLVYFGGDGVLEVVRLGWVVIRGGLVVRRELRSCGDGGLSLLVIQNGAWAGRIGVQ